MKSYKEERRKKKKRKRKENSVAAEVKVGYRANLAQVFYSELEPRFQWFGDKVGQKYSLRRERAMVSAFHFVVAEVRMQCLAYLF